MIYKILPLSFLLFFSCSTAIKPVAVELNPTDAITKSSSDFFSEGELIYLGSKLSAACRQGNIDKAKEIMNKAHKENRQKAMYWNSIGSCYQSLGDTDKAMYYYNFALMLAKNNKQKDTINNNKALLYIKIGNVEKGYLILNELKRSSEVLVHVNRALLSKEIGHTEESKKALDTAKKFAPKDKSLGEIENSLTRDVASVKD